MRGTTHALHGVTGGCLLAGALPVSGWAHDVAGALVPVWAAGVIGSVIVLVAWLVIIGVVVVGALAPDIDSPRAIITTSLGPLGAVGHRVAIDGGRAIFRATQTDRDVDDWNDGHRLITHTGLGAVAAGAVLAVGTLAVGAAASVAAWALPTVLGHLVAALAGTWWVWGLAFGWGALVHILGDTCTVQGTPILWPLTIRGKRWWMVRAPITVHAGGGGERWVVVPVTWAGMVAAALWMVGLWGPLLTLIGALTGSLGWA
jgi:hypothetical protein